jgi:hypothetical protein
MKNFLGSILKEGRRVTSRVHGFSDIAVVIRWRHRARRERGFRKQHFPWISVYRGLRREGEIMIASRLELGEDGL